ncbi:MAG: threonine-phosphate decarboxylase CobD, partial [Thermodesulfobacteriota bacterium]
MKETHGGDIWAAARRAGKSPEEIIDFSASISPLGLSPRAAGAVREALALSGAYPDPDVRELRHALADHHGISPEELLPANGSTELIYLVPSVFRPKKALIVEPAFSEYRYALELGGVSVDEFQCREEDSFLPDIEGLFKRLEGRYDLLYIGNPANPTGALMEKELLLKVVDECGKHGTVVIVDEAFADFSEEDSVKASVGEFENLVVLRSMTKFFSMAGLRLGYLVAPPAVVERFRSFLPPWSVNTLAQAAGVATLGDTEHMEEIKRWFASEREYMPGRLGKFAELEVFPSAANFFMIKSSWDGVAGGHVKDALGERGILVR